MKFTDKPVKTVVVKVGTSSLVDDGGAIDDVKLGNLVDQLAAIKKRKKDLILVSSGAIRAGMEKLGISQRPQTIPEQQASAAIGQGALMQKYAELFGIFSIIPAQVLVTRDDFNNRLRYLNIRNTLYTLLRFGCVPIINENDTVATDEIRIGDNDTLSALVAATVGADLLVNLSDVDGLYDGDPRAGVECKLIEEVAKITPEIEALAGGTHGVCGIGGMRTKIEAAKIATNSGVRMVIANATSPNAIVDVVSGARAGTRFLAKKTELNHRKRWIAFGHRVKGSVIINEGAREMLISRGKSLLAAGIVGCEGVFEIGDLVAVIDEHHNQIARGLTNYAAAELTLIRGKHSDEIETILGYKDFDEVIHRDNLVLGV
ncbi:MAG: glutamate 5-kinase [Armatimonadetes bacterium]|nr:glutamate 5-kinase [Armatimonadota bacterium]